MNVSGAEAVVAAASPFLGEGESACLVKPYVDVMTESEIHLVMTSGEFSLSLKVHGCQGLNLKFLRVLYNCWRCLKRVHQPGCPCPKPYYGVCHEYSCLHRYQ
jgi:hypothetical protein